MFEFEIEGIKFRVNPIDPFGSGSELIIYLERLSGADWEALAYPSIYSTDCLTKESTHEALTKAYVALNKELTSLFGKDTSVPTEGFELVRYLITKGTIVVDDNLSIKVD